MKATGRLFTLCGITVIAILCCVTAEAASVGSKVKEANGLLERGESDEALRLYRDAQIDSPASSEIHYNIGNALYRQGKFDEAEKEYTQALGTEDIALQADTYYNLGNTNYRSGKLLEALENYKKCLEVRDDDEDAKYNIEMIQKKLKESAEKKEGTGMSQQQQQAQGAQSGTQHKEEGANQSEEKQGEKGEKEKTQAVHEEEKENGSEESSGEVGEEEEGNKNEEGSGEEKEAAQASSQQKQGQGSEMTKEDAERILNAMGQAEKDQLKELQKTTISRDAIRVEKDW
ncbi:MAG: tetratricopeptide repeat protein [Candidatus Omnitrophica bacterium]|nr:tetratricopeptide repeat protein [Candidatus Omnitrophota bacterium]